jgi:cathepsin L
MKSALLIAAVASAKELPSFESFVELHARSYQRGSAEFEQRKALYQQHLADAEVQNSSPDKKWVAGVNRLWDWTEAELQSLRGWDGAMMPNGGSSERSISKHGSFLQQTNDLPKEKLWDNLETFAYVKDQASCGSCWAIASATVLEAHNEIYNKNHRIFSTQQIVECTPNPRHCGGDGGCKGATAELAMEWVLKNGLSDASEVPYTAKDGACTRGSQAGKKVSLLDVSAPSADLGGAAFGMTGWSTLPKNMYEPLARALAESGPVAVSVAAGGTWFQYESGVFNGCGKDAVIDHAVVAIGYGEEAGNKFWTIQNSWGPDWGEEGLIRLERHTEAGGYCGMNNDPQKGVACKGETAAVPVCGMCGVLFDSVVPHFKGSNFK